VKALVAAVYECERALRKHDPGAVVHVRVFAAAIVRRRSKPAITIVGTTDVFRPLRASSVEVWGYPTIRSATAAFVEHVAKLGGDLADLRVRRAKRQAAADLRSREAR
jgi:hypothetical protein